MSLTFLPLKGIRMSGLVLVFSRSILIILCSNNYYAYVNSTEPDPFGILRFLTDELQASEDAGQRGS